MRPSACCLVLALAFSIPAFAAGPARQLTPRTPAEALQGFQLHPDCQIELVASEPDVIDPVAMTFGPDGRLWVVEYSDYPNGPGDGEPGRSRIRILTDADGDGRYDHAQVFAEKLLFANGLLLWKDGVIVTTDGKVLFLRDANGDGRADETQVWFQGFAVENPQLRCNHPTLGLDDRIYVANGLRGGKIVPGPDNPWKLDPAAAPLSISGMDFRFDPLTGAYEAISGMGQFGLTFDDWGNRFSCDNRHPCKQVVLEDDALKRTPWLRVKRVFEDVSPAEDQSRVYPLSRTWTTSNLHANQFTAACGVTIFRGTGLPADFYGNSFVCEPTANLVHRDILIPRGATFTSRPGQEGVEFLATRDEWFRPVNFAHGPDGALYLCDMYRAVIEHPQFMPDELKNRPDLLLGTDAGRIYRIHGKNPGSKPPENETRLAGQSSAQLIDLLSHPNLWQRETAQRLLLERQDKSIAAALHRLIADDRSGWGAGAALWLLDSLSDLKFEDIQAGLRHPAAQRQALQLGALRFGEQPAFSAAALQVFARSAKEAPAAVPFGRKDPQLAYQYFLAVPWSKMTEPTPEISGMSPQQFAAPFLLLSDDDVALGWSRNILTISAGERLLDCTLLMFSNLQIALDSSQAIRLAESLRFFSEALGRRNQEGDAKRLLEYVLDLGATSGAQAWQRGALGGLLTGLPGGRARLQKLLESLTAPQRQIYETTVAAISAAAHSAQDFSKELLPDVPLLTLQAPEAAAADLSKLISGRDGQLASAAVTALASLPDSVSGPALVKLLPSRTPQLRRELIAALAVPAPRCQLLLDEVEAKRVTPLEIDPGQQKALLAAKDEALKSRAQKLLQQAPPADRLQVLADYAPCLNRSGDPQRGRSIFEKNCATCHKIGDLGVNVAPDISDSRTKTPDFLLTNILDPNRAIDNNYFSFTVVDTSGRIQTGVIASETSAAVTLKQPEGKIVTIPREEIEELRNNGVSLMPVGLERTITPEQMADLISFIKNWRYLDGQVPAEAIR